jgi:N6-L-threonylcarbamoyladenine synthase
MYILGIESSCDDSAASVLDYNPDSKNLAVLSNIISSQIEIHSKYGGVIPEVAAREHVLNILPVIDEALSAAKINPNDLAAIAVTKGPGLITSLITGLETARSLSFAWKKPLVGVNHIEGHIYANFINPDFNIKLPAIILTVSGGHTILLHMDENRLIKIIGETRDDAAGEAFDKAAQMLGLAYPGGPAISREAAKAKNPAPCQLPRPMLNSPDYDFSFSGLKTALLYALKKDSNWKDGIPEYCQEFQQAVVDILSAKTIKAAKNYQVASVMLAGGVSANKSLRESLAAAVSQKLPGREFLCPKPQYTTDNAAMIAAAGAFKLAAGQSSDYRDIKVDACLQLN